MERVAVSLLRVLVLTSVLLPLGGAAALAADVPAEYTGKFKSCPEKYPGSFLDIGRDECWQCPAATPKRTIWPVNGAWSCEKPAYEDFKRAAGPMNPTGLFGTDCKSGYFLDIGHGKCYSCRGYNRSLHPVTHPRACSKLIPLVKGRAVLKGTAGCDEGFRHLLSSSCYACPVGSYRNMNTGSDPSEFGACTVCGTLDATPCPVTTLRKSCDPGLVEHFAKGVCVIDDSHEGRIYRKALAKAEELAPQIGGIILNANTLSQDKALIDDLNNKSPTAAGKAQQAVGANPCVLDAVNTWTLGGTVNLTLFVGGELETGMAVDIRKAAREGTTPQRNAYWYGGASYNFSLAAGLSAGINYGCWMADNNAIHGDFEGGTFDPLGTAKIAAAMKVKEMQTIKDAFKTGGVSVALGVWFDPETGEYTGFTITPSYGRGIGFGGYAKGSTLQIP